MVDNLLPRSTDGLQSSEGAVRSELEAPRCSSEEGIRLHSEALIENKSMRIDLLKAKSCVLLVYMDGKGDYSMVNADRIHGGEEQQLPLE